MPKTRRVMKKLDKKQWADVYARVKGFKKEVLTPNELVDFGLFTSAGQASGRRYLNQVPRFITSQTGGRIFYPKEDILDWITLEFPDHIISEKLDTSPRPTQKKKPKTSISLPINRKIDRNLTDFVCIRLPVWILEIIKGDRTLNTDVQLKQQWILDRVIESLVTNEPIGLNESLNRAYLILREGLDGTERKAEQAKSHG